MWSGIAKYIHNVAWYLITTTKAYLIFGPVIYYLFPCYIFNIYKMQRVLFYEIVCRKWKNIIGKVHCNMKYYDRC